MNGISIIGLLGVAFVVLKLTGFIDWSWLWVTAPFWGGLALVSAILVFWGVIAIITTLASSRRIKTKRRPGKI